MDYRNAQTTRDGSYTCEVNHPSLGWIPFTAVADDTEQFGRDLFAAIAEAGDAAAYQPPAPRAADVRAEGARRLRHLVAEYSDEERETWMQQVEEAQALGADAETPVPLLTALAARRTETVAELAALILQKSAQYKLAAGQVLSSQSALLQMDDIPGDFADDRHWP